MSSKRDDLQVVRGAAIISVLLFHFFPDWFPNGYVGVDQFFVLSGFLMMMIFGSKAINLKTSGKFYYRRMKRIVPLYFLVILIGLILTFVAFPESFVSVNVESARNAALLITNLVDRSNENDYFLQLETAYDIFTHTWSLAVEMQFYLIAPLFFFVCSKLGQSGNFVDLAFLFICYVLSLGYQCIASDDVAFNSMLCRMWQFETGIIAYTLCPTNTDYQLLAVKTKNEAEHLEEKSSPTPRHSRSALCDLLDSFLFCTSLFVSLYLSFTSYELPPQFTRICSTIAAGVVIALAPRFDYAFLSNRVFVFIGDISFALYLVHWPIYCWVKILYKDDYRAYTLGLLIAVLLAIFISKTFEQWYLRLGSCGIWAMIIIFAAAIAGVIVKSNEINHYIDKLRGTYDTSDLWDARFDPNMDIDEVKRLAKIFEKEPTLFSKICNPRAYGNCDVNSTDLGKTANNSILVLGNSYAENVFGELTRHFAKFASKMHKLTFPGCGVLEHYVLVGCSPLFGEYFKYANRSRPDILFIIARHIPAFHEPITDISTDNLTKGAWEQLKKYEEIVKKRIYILDAYGIVIKSKYYKEYYAALDNNTTINAKAKELYDVAGYNNTITRYDEIKKRCTKCVFYSYVEALSDSNGNYLLADPDTRLPLFHFTGHLSPMGQRRIEPVYEKLARGLEMEIENKTFV